MTGGGPFALPPGAWTDDTAMALVLADSLAATGTLDCRDLMERFVRWWRNGEYSCTGTCFDIGNATSGALDRYLRTGDPFAGTTHPRTAGNGSLMRLAPIALPFWSDRSRPIATAAAQSRRRLRLLNSSGAEPIQDEIRECKLCEFVICRGSGWRITSTQFALVVAGLKRNYSDVEGG